MHVTHKLLMAVFEGEVPRKVLEEIVKEHLMFLCPVCRKEIETFDWRQYREEVPGPGAYEAPIARVVEKVKRRQFAVAAEEKKARVWLKELRKLPADERREKIARAHSRFRGRTFVELLLDETRSHLPGDPWQALSWADASFVAVYQTPTFEKEDELLVQALAHRGNAYRAAGDLRAADSDFRAARTQTNDKDVTDLSVLAELDSLEGSLRKDERDLERASKLLSRSSLLYRLLGEETLVARTQIKLGLVYYDLGETEDSIGALRESLSALSMETTPLLYLLARLNLARSLEEFGELDGAEVILKEDCESQADHLDRQNLNRVRWLEGRIARARGDLPLAEERLREARRGAIDVGIAYDVAMFSLDLALTLLDRGKIRELREIAREALKIFGVYDVRPEAFAAFRLFASAAAADRLTAEIITKTTSALREAYAKPEKSRPVVS